MKGKFNQSINVFGNGNYVESHASPLNLQFTIRNVDQVLVIRLSELMFMYCNRCVFRNSYL